MLTLGVQIVWLFVLAVPIACIAWTVTHEEILREPREYAERESETARSFWRRKFFYVLTCEYCFSHYVAIAFLLLTGYKLLLDDWRGYLIAGFALVWVANLYMALFAQAKLEVKKDRVEIKKVQQEVEGGETEEKPRLAA
jgi:hypothetical protein